MRVYTGIDYVKQGKPRLLRLLKRRYSVDVPARGVSSLFSVVLINIIIIVTAVLIHYEFLYRFTVIMPVLRVRQRTRIVIGVFAALCAHAVEVWVFALAYYWMHNHSDWGQFEGNFNGSLMDCVYFSFTTFTTLGFGDIEPIGDVRYLTGLEALTGLVLITWSASFLYLEMTRYWGNER